MKIDYIFISFLILLVISFITLIIILLSNKPERHSEYKNIDTTITSFSSINFIEAEPTSVYNESSPNLGFTGRLILDCFSGICQEIDYYYDSEGDLTYDFIDKLDYSCSEQCSYNGRSECHCEDPYEDKGKCYRRYDDYYENGKYCYGYNIINFWKGKKYTILKKEVYTYYQNAILKDEECPKGQKNCGIIDDNENKLCIPSSSNCPINYFAESKINENKIHSTVLIGNKTFYYTFDDDITKKRKIIAGLIADSDLYLNENNVEKTLIDTGTISQFLADNQNLYKGINLGYDPYKNENIDSKGNSYLRLFYNNKVDLPSLRENMNKNSFNHKMNEDLIKPINKKIKLTSIFGLISSGLLLIFLVLYIIKKLKEFIICNSFLFFVFIILSLVFGCINISNFNELKEKEYKDISLARKINFIIVIIGFVLFAYYIFLLVYIYYLRDKCRDCGECCCKSNKMSQNIFNTINNNSSIVSPNNTEIGKDFKVEKNSTQDTKK